ncbi:hypothetical protein Pmani_013254 [Petrolisthes manimaculis]|uniref:Peptidase M12A domain-containing protein n=1 Tax=Petrolisthes manimaculis TaxID=1843537 RepID=A0AAE1PWE4_9EUCA|nr:hypothetical protein Pmani_013254 [Petrolisthes manimaculis]
MHPDFLENNPDEVEGEKLFEGDILLTPTQRRALNERKGIANPYYRWPDGRDGLPLVPYTFGDRYVDRLAVLEGLEHWMEHTCITFERATSTRIPHLRFIKGSGCYSYIGRMGQWRGQPVSIGNNCNVGTTCLVGIDSSWEYGPTNIITDWLPTAKSQSPEVEVRQLFRKILTRNIASFHLYTDGSKTDECVGGNLGIVVHEVGHAIGFVHEQSRPDRDNYIKIISRNVIRNRLSNFNKYSNAVINNMDVPYDYSSVMHYGPKGYTWCLEVAGSVESRQRQKSTFQDECRSQNGRARRRSYPGVARMLTHADILGYMTDDAFEITKT